MATPDGRHEPMGIAGNPGFRRQKRRVDPTIDTMSSPSRDFTTQWGAPADTEILAISTLRSDRANGKAFTQGGRRVDAQAGLRQEIGDPARIPPFGDGIRAPTLDLRDIKPSSKCARGG
jgi:hypothetical protein